MIIINIALLMIRWMKSDGRIPRSLPCPFLSFSFSSRFFRLFFSLSSSTKSWQWENLAPQLPILLVNCGPKILLATLCFGDTLYVFHHSKMVEIYILDHKEWTLNILFTVDEYMDPHHFWTDNSHVLSDAINRTLFILWWKASATQMRREIHQSWSQRYVWDEEWTHQAPPANSILHDQRHLTTFWSILIAVF